MSLVDTLLDKAIEMVSPSDPTVLLEGCDQANRIIRLVKTGKKYSVSRDDETIECSSKKEAELEFEFRINDSNKNL